jgi:hypothetical protein
MPPLILLAAAAAAQPAPAEQIRARDANFFALFFTGPCDAARFRSFITDDVEFYHDKAGFNVHKAQDFIDIFTKDCTRGRTRANGARAASWSPPASTSIRSPAGAQCRLASTSSTNVRA